MRILRKYYSLPRFTYFSRLHSRPQQWRSGLERWPRKWKVGVFESQPRQTSVVKTGSDSSTSKRSALGASVTGPMRWPLYTDAPCHSRCGTLKSAKHRSKVATLHRQWRRFQMREKFSSGTKNSKQTKHSPKCIYKNPQEIKSKTRVRFEPDTHRLLDHLSTDWATCTKCYQI